jgi:hypothetical protein
MPGKNRCSMIARIRLDQTFRHADLREGNRGYRVPLVPSRKASFLLQACDCLHDGHATRFSPIGLLFQVNGSATSPVAMGLPLTGQRIITRAGGMDICFMALSHAASVKAAHDCLDAEPDKGNVSGQQLEHAVFRIRLTIHAAVEAIAGVKTAAGGRGDLPAKT